MKGTNMRLKPFLVLFAVGILLAANEIVQGHITGNAAQLTGTVMGYGVGAGIWAFPYCWFTRKKYKSHLEAKKSD
jgi:hypothetical protein